MNGVIEQAYRNYIIDRDMGYSHEEAFAKAQKKYYMTSAQFAEAVRVLGAYEPA